MKLRVSGRYWSQGQFRGKARDGHFSGIILACIQRNLGRTGNISETFLKRSRISH